MSHRWSGLLWSRFLGRRERDEFTARNRSFEDRVRRALKRVCKVNHHATPPIVQHFFFGTPAADPSALTVVFLFRDDEARARAEANGLTAHLTREVHRALRAEGFPEDVLPQIAVQFASKKAVDLAGGPWVYFQ